MEEDVVTKRNPLDPAEVFAKMVGGRKVCRECTPFTRARLMGSGDGKHPACEDRECGCRCQDGTRAN
jgi:hypothetical protein